MPEPLKPTKYKPLKKERPVPKGGPQGLAPAPKPRVLSKRPVPLPRSSPYPKTIAEKVKKLIDEITPYYKPEAISAFNKILRACLHGGGGPQVGEVTRLAVVEKWLAFTCKITTPGSRGDVTRRCYVVARHVDRENGRRTSHFGGQYSFPLIICSRCNISVPWLFTVTFDEFGALWRACKCNMNSTPARRVTPP